MSIPSDNGLQSLRMHNLAFTVSNLENAIQWYEDVLGFTVLNRTTFKGLDANLAFMKKADVRLEILELKSGFRIDAMFADAPGHLLPIGNKVLVLQVDDLHAATRELEAKGVSFAWKEVNREEGALLSTMIRDMDGNFINIFQHDSVLKLV